MLAIFPERMAWLPFDVCCRPACCLLSFSSRIEQRSNQMSKLPCLCRCPASGAISVHSLVLHSDILKFFGVRYSACTDQAARTFRGTYSSCRPDGCIAKVQIADIFKRYLSDCKPESILTCKIWDYAETRSLISSCSLSQVCSDRGAHGPADRCQCIICLESRHETKSQSQGVEEKHSVGHAQSILLHEHSCRSLFCPHA